MYDRAKDLVDAYMRRQLGRRELIGRMGQLGVGAVVANSLLGRASTPGARRRLRLEAASGHAAQPCS